MTNPQEIEETIIPDREGNPTIVHRGDRVHLVDISSITDEEEKFLAGRHVDFLHEWLGEGPYTISDIGRWPCGRVMIYIATKTSSGSGVYAEDLVLSENSRATQVSASK